MAGSSELISWLASFPKSGNTFVRTLVSAYMHNGYLDLNRIDCTRGDSAKSYLLQAVPLPHNEMGNRGTWLMRPAQLVHSMIGRMDPKLMKTHFANLKPEGLPAFIPPELTKRAIYIVRDPRSVVLSFSKYYSKSIPRTLEMMAHHDLTIGGGSESEQTPTMVSSWSNHVRSWIGNSGDYPFLLVRYEDLVDDTAGSLKEIIEFLELEYDEDRANRAIEATQLSRLSREEKENGFKENLKPENGQFFGEGGTRWQDELGARYVKEIERDHGEVMEQIGYL